ncbi:hypothetical protein [Pseudoroseomonas ludipueritiae]|uniref:Uncharacterized protein n=1 Tax=Pseudoroseomonas ludipueritiae TaxID=198093 RepID=A0ABR7R328_9PROT|nr:hypothetical protein [Pseudoroseomonas ludipueritiae]MBC9176149.1 hypothetical protein [Pseudoroseomonas ludipueritiae]
MLEDASYALSRDVLARVAPDDMEDFEAVATFQREGARGTAKGVGISLDLGLIGTSLIGLLLPSVQKALVMLVDRCLAAGVDAADKRLQSWLKEEPGAGKRDLTASQRESVVADAVRVASDNGLDAKACDVLRDLLLTRIPAQADA